MATGPRYGYAALASVLTVLFVACATPRAEHMPPAEQAPASAAAPAPAKIQYPTTARGDVVDDYHGIKVPDPYRCFEDPAAQATRDWVAAENAVSKPYLEGLPQRAWLGARLTQLWQYARFGVPRREGGKDFYMRNAGKQDQSV